jgi:hypothetical protein
MRVWWIWMTSGALLCAAVALLLPSDSVPTSAVYDAIGVATVVATIVGVRWTASSTAASCSATSAGPARRCTPR